MLSIQTNVNSLIAQENLRVNSDFQSKTIQRLTSGYRINQSGDDAAGLAVANKFRNSVAELTQGVNNANDGLSALQVIDGGLNNIGQILDRMKTLATQSATTTFTGDRSTLNNEYQSLVSEIDRQAANVGLNSGGTYNTTLAVYIGGGGTNQSNSIVNIDLSGAGNASDSNSLAVSGTTLLAGGTDFTEASPVNLNTEIGPALLAGGANTTQVFTVNLAGGTTVTATVSSGAATGGITVADALQQLNNQLSSHGITASVDSATGNLMFSADVAFTASAAAASAGTGLVDTGSTIQNTAMYIANGAATFVTIPAGDSEKFTVTNTTSGTATTVTLAAGTTMAAAVAQLNTNLAGVGVHAVENTAGTGIDLQGAGAFTVTKPQNLVTAGGVAGVFVTSTGGDITPTINAPAASTNGVTGNALTALTAVTTAVATLGLIQGHVGAGENKLNYAINLAQSQVSNFSTAESRIRDTDVASEAANLTKAQVLQQATIAAMAQANTAPQAVLALLRA